MSLITLCKRISPIGLILFGLLCPKPCFAQEADRSGKVNDYDQWRQALGSDLATDSDQVVTLPGYEVELIRSAGPDEGSWVALAFDPQGRLTIAREDKGLLRLSLPGVSKGVPVGEEISIESINNGLLECRGLLYAEGYLFANANNSKGLYRLKDTTGDDQFDEVKLLKETPGNVGHGRNNLTMGPDGRIYIIHGNDTRLPEDFLLGNSPYRHTAEDRLLPCAWNNQLFNAGVKPPAGHVIRTDIDGKTWELMAGGMRNPFGIAFNPDGEMFTFDADMEWDEGLPWYRPCRVNHLVSGGEYGWRQGNSKWCSWFPDGLPSTLDIGLASPTSVMFGTKSNFSPEYQQALYICDWAYGRIIAVHLTPQGASYAAKAETFVRGRPLNVTGLTFGPDGAMYFTTGGRKTQAGLYRVRYVGPPEPGNPPSAAELQAAANARELRKKLESFHGRVDPKAVEFCWPHLGSDDPWIRHAARVALEMQPASSWQRRALSEPNQAIAVNALLALARLGESSVQETLLKRLIELSGKQLTEQEQLTAVRAVQISLVRQGSASDALSTALLDRYEALYPASTPQLNFLLCELLVYLNSQDVVEKTLSLLATAKTQEEKIHYLYTLRHVKENWQPPQRKLYFSWLAESDAFHGARYFNTSMEQIKAEALATVPDQEKVAYEKMLEKPAVAMEFDLGPQEDRKFVREWTLDDLAGSLDAVGAKRDLKRGQAMFAAANCIKCHRFAGQGQTVGPDLSGVARRFGRRDMLVSILFPSKVIDDKYRNVIVQTDRGQTLIGSLAGDDGETIHLVTDPAKPGKTVSIKKDEIESQQFSLTSPMPAGTLNTLTKEEILDLLAYLESIQGGQMAKAPADKP